MVARNSKRFLASQSREITFPAMGADKHPTSKVMLSIEEARERLRDAGWLGPIENRVWTDEHGEIIARYKGSEPDVPEGVVKSGWEGESVTSAALVGFDRENR